MVSFEIFVKAMPPSLLESKILPSFCFAFKIPDDVAASNVYRYLIISGTAKWHIDEKIFEAEAGKLIHHPPSAGHRFVTTDQPLLAIWIRTGKIEGKYWFVGHEDVAQIGENWQQST